MFNRSVLKDFAKQRLQQGRGTAILVGFLTMLLAGTGGGVTYLFKQDDSSFPFSVSEWPTLFGFVAVVAITAALVALAYQIFVANVITLGSRGWYLRYWRGELPPTGELFASFRIYKPAVSTMLVKNIYIFLWSLLFVIPGIVKSYAYSMTEYILYENPNLTADQAIALSKRLTNGSKGALFVFDLSYLGWDILNAFTFGLLGIFYVYPYRFTAHAAIYQSLKDAAIANGTLQYEDFGQMPPAENV